MRLPISRTVAVALANPVSTPICPGCSDATMAVAALPITAPNQAGSSRAGTGCAGMNGRPSFAIARVSHRDRCHELTDERHPAGAEP